jgi:hypothetical protein
LNLNDDDDDIRRKRHFVRFFAILTSTSMMSVLDNTSTPPDYEKQADELCRLFSTTLHSLASDAAAVRQLSSLAKVTGVLGDDDDDEEENRKPNVQKSDSLKQLQNLDKVVMAMEQKVVALRSIVSEEKKAIARFEGSLKGECEAQTLAINRLSQGCQEIRSKQTTTREESSPAAASNKTTRPALKPRKDSVDPRSDYHQQEPAATQPVHETHIANWASFAPVLPKELEGISRNTLRRVQLIDLNEALEEIEWVVQTKFDSLPKPFSLSEISSSVRQRRYEYLKQQRGPSFKDIEVEAHLGHFWVSEQELRENCIFFRNGESTARAILAILCSLRRLKQIPGKKRQVTYLCFVQEQEEE